MKVVIVGAGPAGASLAMALARAGLTVNLVEAAARFQRSFRGDALMPSGLEALERLGLLPIPSQLPQRPLGGWRVAVEGRTLFQLAEPLEGAGARPCTLVSQDAWLSWLLNEAPRPASLSLQLGEPVGELQRNGDGRVCGVVLASGQVLPADVVVGCDGRASLLRRRAGLALCRAASAIDVLWFCFATGAQPLPDDCFTTLVGPAALASLFTGANGQVQLGWGIAPQAPTPSLTPGDWITQLAAQAPPPLAHWLVANARHLGEPVRLSVQVGMVERWWQPGLLLLGDAAHPMSAVRAQGINMALRDAAVAADQLIAASAASPAVGSHHQAIDRALSAIETARRPEVERLQQLQADELQRGELLRQLPPLRWALAAAAPVIGPRIAQHWRHQQLPLRHGIAPLPVQQ